jgi:hypothetical protein
MEFLSKIIIFLFAITGIIATAGYIPTIKDLTKKIASANILSYIIWTFSSCISFLYALLIISDLLLTIVSGVNFLCCTIILILALRLKYTKKI